MAARFEIVTDTEEDIFKQLDNDLFWNDITREQLEVCMGIDPISEADQLVYGALQRALDITIPTGINGTMATKGIIKQ